MKTSYPFDPELHEEGSTARSGRCSYHEAGSEQPGECTGEAVVSFQDAHDQWQAGCSLALESLVEEGKIEPLGQGG